MFSRRGLALLISTLAAAFGLAGFVLAQTPSPPVILSAAATDATNTSVRVQFSEPVFTDYDDTAGVSGDLTAADFSLNGGTAGADIASVAKATAPDPADGTVWIVTTTNAVSTGATIGAAADTVFGAGGVSVGAVQAPIDSLTPARLAAIVTGLQELAQVDLFADRSYAYPLGQPLDGETLDDLFAAGFAALPSAPANEAELVGALADLSTPASTVTIVEGVVTLPLATTQSVQVPVTFGLGDVGLSVGKPDVTMSRAVTGTLEVQLDGTGAFDVVTTAANELAVALTGTADFDAAGRLGFAEVTAKSVTPTVNASFLVDLVDPPTGPSPAPIVAVDVDLVGTAVLELVEFEVDGIQNPISAQTTATWNLATPDAAPTVDLANLASSGLANFSNIDAQDVLSGLSYIATWLTEIETYGAVGAELPIIGEAAGDLADVATQVDQAVQYLSEGVEAFSAGDDDPSVADVAELLCGADMFGASTDCETLQAVLAPLTISTTEITYDLSLTKTVDPFDDGLPDSYELEPNDACAAIADGVAGVSSARFRVYNPSILTRSACDQLSVGTIVNIELPDLDPATTTRTAPVTAAAVCDGVGALFDVELGDFKSRNGFADDVACASAIAAAVGDPVGNPLIYDDDPDDGPSLDFAVGEQLDGLDVGVDGTVNWDTRNATIEFNFTLGLKIAPTATIDAELGLDPNDWDGDGTPNSTDTDDDGDGEIDTTDVDDDADGLPEDYLLQPNDVCRAVAGTIAGRSAGDFIAANAAIADQTGCDLIVAGTTINMAEPGEVADDRVLTAGDMCRSAAKLFQVGVADFRSYNFFVDDAACAAEFAAAAIDPAAHPLSYDPLTRFSLVTTGHRIFVGADPTTPLVEVSLNLAGTGSASATLGFLDVDIDGSLSLAPTFGVTLVDPMSSADDSKIDLVELRETLTGDASAAAKLDTLVDLDAGGEIDGHFLVGSSGLDIDGTDRLRFDVVGNLSALDNDFGTTPTPILETLSKAIDNSGTTDLTGVIATVDPSSVDTIYVGTNLDELTSLESLTSAQIIDMLVSLAERIDELAGTDVLSQRLPLVDVTVSEAVGFVQTFATLAEQVQARSPEDLASLNAVISETLADLGVPDSVSVTVSADDIRFTFSLDETVSASYPLNLDLDGLSLAPSDGGASVDVSAGVNWQPTVGVRFASGLAPLDRVFLAPTAPSFTASLDAEIEGGVVVGPFEASIAGDAMLAASVAVDLTDPTPGDDMVTFTELRDTLSTAPGSLIDVTFDGPLTADLNATLETPAGPLSGDIKVRGNLVAFAAPNPFSFVTLAGVPTDDPADLDKIYVANDIDVSQFKLDLRTIVNGSIETARFVGRTLEDADGLNLDIPVVGDVLTTISPIGEDITAIANEIDSVWRADPTAFTSAIEAPLETLVFDAGICPSQDCVAVALRDASGDPVTAVADASEFTLDLALAGEFTASEMLDAGLDLAPLFALDFTLEPTVTFGYSFDVGFGINLNDGFFVKGGEVIEIYAKATARNVVASATLLEIGQVDITDGTVAIGGAGGPDDDAAGVAVCLLACDGSENLTMSELTNRSRDVDSLITVDPSIALTVDLDVETSIDLLPTITFPLHFDIGYDSTEVTGPNLTLGTETDPVTLDAQGFVEGVILPGLNTLDQYSPLSDPNIQKVLNDEIPILETNLRTLADAFANAPGAPPAVSQAWAVFEFLVDLKCTISDLDPATMRPSTCGPRAGLGTDPGQIPLGYVTVLPSFSATPVGSAPTVAGPTVAPGAAPATAAASPLDTLKGLISSLNGRAVTDPPMFRSDLLDNPLDAVKLLLGGDLADDTTFIEFNAPPIRVGPSIKFEQELFNLETGFLDGALTVGFDGFLGLDIKVGFGYDSSGLGPGKDFINGFYLVDYGADDTEDFEVAVGGSVEAFVDGKLSVLGGLADVRFRGSGGVKLVGGIDLNDESIAVPAEGRGDGKFHLDEMLSVIDAHDLGPLCLFNVGIDFDGYLSFGGKAKVLGITVFNDSYSTSFTVLHERLRCTPRFRVAQLVDGQLILNGGPQYGADRFDGLGDRAEQFTLTRSGSNIVVSLNVPGSNNTYSPLSFPAAGVTGILGDLGNFDDTVTIVGDISHPMTLNGGPGVDTLNGGSGPDVISGGPGIDTLNGNSGADTLDGGADNDNVNGGPGADMVGGGAGNDQLDGGADADQLEGGAGNDTNSFVGDFGADVVDDAAGRDTLDFTGTAGPLTGTSSFGDAAMADTSGNSVTYAAADIDVVLGSPLGDTFALKASVPEGFRIDGKAGNDTYNAFLAGAQRTIAVDDTGTDGVDDTVNTYGTVGANRFLLRKADNGSAFVALLSASRADRVNYNAQIEQLNVFGLAGSDEFSVDDNAASTRIIGGEGADRVQVGQIYGQAACIPTGPNSATCPGDPNSTRNGAVGVDPDDAFPTAVITRGHLSNGVTQPLTIDGDDGNDTITIFSNKAPVTANGGPGRDKFVARAFIITDSVQLNGDGDIDDFDYVLNDQLSVDGGEGVDTFTIVGTEANDGFVVDTDGAGAPTIMLCKVDPDSGRPDLRQPCPINSQAENVEVFELLGIEGDDVFWIRSSAASTLVQMAGGEHSDRFIIGDGTTSNINGPVTIAGDDSGTVPGIADPVVLPGENTEPAFAPSSTSGTDRGDTLELDASADTSGLIGEVTDTAIRGLGMASGPFTIGAGTDIQIVAEVVSHDDLEFAEIVLGSGTDDVTVTSTHVGNTVCDSDGCPLRLLTGGGIDLVDVQSIAGETVVDLGADDDVLTVGAPITGGDELDQIDAQLTVLGDTGADALDLDDTADASTRVDVDPGVITGAGLAQGGVVHTAVETVHVRLGDDDDTVNVRGTAADASTATHVHGNDGDDTFYVSGVAALDTFTTTDHLGGDLDQVDGPLFIHGDRGAGNRLLISDRGAAAGDSEVTYDGQILTGLAPAAIHHDVTGAFGRGITMWSSESADEISVSGSDLSTVPGTRTLTTLNSGAGPDVLTVDLIDGEDGPFVVNAEEGPDIVNADGSSLDLLVFGGLGVDTLDTGSGDDIVLGDVGTIETADGGTVTGGGGPGDITDGGTQPVDQITSDPSGGDDDIIDTGAGDDLTIGGTGGDEIHGGPGSDVLIGGHSLAGAPDADDHIDGDGGEDLIAGDNASLDIDGPTDVLVLHDVETTATPAPAGSGSGDIIRGGPDDDAIYGQQGNDDLSGNSGDDTVEGNAGEDMISGGVGQDDLLGGGSALDGILDGQRAWTVAGEGLADANDTIDGGDDADVLLGDNGLIERSSNGDGTPTRLADLFGARNASYDSVLVRTVQMTDGIDPAGSFGADLLRGGDGHDELYGQLDTTRTTVGGNAIAGDELSGGPGDDVLLGDLGVVTTVLEDGSRRESIAPNGPFLSAEIHTNGTITREVMLYMAHDGDHVDAGDGSDAAEFGAEGDDVINGDEGDDVVHGGSGNDIANGGDGTDVLFGGDGRDALWGGLGDDEMFGGHDEDALDVMPRDFTTTTKGRNKVVLGPDPDIWFEAAPSFSALGGLDFAYGGWNADELQADEKSNGPKPGDRLLDWHGVYNTYLSCENGGGAGTFLRSGPPSTSAYLAELATGRGAVDASMAGASGYRELGLVQQEDGTFNVGPSLGSTSHVACP